MTDQSKDNMQSDQIAQLFQAVGGADGMKHLLGVLAKIGSGPVDSLPGDVVAAKTDDRGVVEREQVGVVGDRVMANDSGGCRPGSGAKVDVDLIDVSGVSLESGVFSDTSSSGRSSASWSDMMDEEDAKKGKVRESKRFFSGSGGGVQMPGVAAKNGALASVKFVQEAESDKFFANYVRVPEVRALRSELAAWGVSVPKSHIEELALARYSQATVPSGFVNGKERLKVLAKVGDNVLTLLLTDELYGEGVSVSEVQNKCSSVLSGGMLSRLCYSSGLSKFVSFPAGLDVVASRPAGEALEAMVGVMYHSRGVEGVRVFMRRIGLLKQ